MLILSALPVHTQIQAKPYRIAILRPQRARAPILKPLSLRTRRFRRPGNGIFARASGRAVDYVRVSLYECRPNKTQYRLTSPESARTLSFLAETRFVTTNGRKVDTEQCAKSLCFFIPNMRTCVFCCSSVEAETLLCFFF